ncbi:MAG: hypothetical protein AAF211_23730 [Myxococcota bacterium]
MSREEDLPAQEDDEVTRQLRADAARTGGLPDDLWDKIDADLTRGGVRDQVVSWSTPVRIVVGLVGVLLVGALFVAMQGVRADLSSDGWQRFGFAALPLVVAGLAASGFSLLSRGRLPAAPGLAIVAAWAAMIVSSIYGDWPGMPKVPAAMDLWCFGMTSLATLIAMGWLTWLERARRPVVWRIGTAAAGSGLIAYLAQGVFCPGVDPLHLVFAHGGAAVLWSVVGMLAALGLVLRR